MAKNMDAKGSWLSWIVDRCPKWRALKYQAFLEQWSQAVPDAYMHLHALQCSLQGKNSFTLKKLAALTSRKQYRLCLAALRALLSSKHYKRHKTRPELAEIALLHRLARAFFTVNMYPLTAEIVEHLAAVPPSLAPLSEGEHLLAAWHAIEAKPPAAKIVPWKREWRRLRARLSWNFDPYKEGNLPYRLFNLHIENASQARWEVLNVRMGCPTYERQPFAKAFVTPEFTGFLEAYAQLGKRHLYINLQNRRPKWSCKLLRLNHEGYRCLAIEELQHAFANTLWVVTLSKDCAFYAQAGSYGHLEMDWPDFKAAFLQHMAADASAFYFPPVLRQDPSFWQGIEDLLTEVHQEVFDGQASLSLKERQDYIELFYTRLQEYLLIKLAVHSYNVTCTDGIDRAGGANSLMYYYQRLKTQATGDNLSQLKVLLFAPALLVRMRPIRKKRLQRFLSAAETLAAAYQRKPLTWKALEKQRVVAIEFPAIAEGAEAAGKACHN